MSQGRDLHHLAELWLLEGLWLLLLAPHAGKLLHQLCHLIHIRLTSAGAWHSWHTAHAAHAWHSRHALSWSLLLLAWLSDMEGFDVTIFAKQLV